MELKEILERVSIQYTNERKNAILKILDENNIFYEIQEIENKTPIYTSKHSFWDNFLEDDDEDDYYDKVINYSSHYYYNIFVDIGNFEQSEKKILFTTHYDVVRGSTGANDNGSSIAILLKLITDKVYTNLPIRIAFLDGEEIGGIGSRGYINKLISIPELKQNIKVINFDVCGCGDDIVIENHINIDGSLTDVLLSDDIKTKYHIIEAPNLPFNDAKIFAQNNIETMCVVVLPKEDIELMHEKYTFNKEFFGRKHFGSYVWEYQHNGKYDNIEYVKIEMMEKIYNYITEIFNQNQITKE